MRVFECTPSSRDLISERGCHSHCPPRSPLPPAESVFKVDKSVPLDVGFAHTGRPDLYVEYEAAMRAAGYTLRNVDTLWGPMMFAPHFGPESFGIYWAPASI